MLPDAPKAVADALKCFQTYHNHSHGTPVPVIRDPSYSECQPEYPPRVWYSPEIDALKFTLHILSVTPGGFQQLKCILLVHFRHLHRHQQQNPYLERIRKMYSNQRHSYWNHVALGLYITFSGVVDWRSGQLKPTAHSTMEFRHRPLIDVYNGMSSRLGGTQGMA